MFCNSPCCLRFLFLFSHTCCWVLTMRQHGSVVPCCCCFCLRIFFHSMFRVCLFHGFVGIFVGCDMRREYTSCTNENDNNNRQIRSGWAIIFYYLQLLHCIRMYHCCCALCVTPYAFDYINFASVYRSLYFAQLRSWGGALMALRPPFSVVLSRFVSFWNVFTLFGLFRQKLLFRN